MIARPAVAFPATPSGRPRRRAPQWATVPQRIAFYSRVDGNGCWIWQTHIMPNGYGRLSNWLAHRLSYVAFVGPIPEGLTIDHLCSVRACVNPNHLEPVTIAENNERGAARRPECKKGHPKTPENLAPRADRPGKFRCLPCLHDQWKAAAA